MIEIKFLSIYIYSSCKFQKLTSNCHNLAVNLSDNLLNIDFLSC